MKYSGQSTPHESARGHVTGEAIYTEDLLSRHPGTLHAWPVLAPHAHAFLLHLDVAPALEEPGVVTTLTAADVPGEGDSGANRHDEPLFPVEVMHHRQAVAWVLAEGRHVTADLLPAGEEARAADTESMVDAVIAALSPGSGAHP